MYTLPREKGILYIPNIKIFLLGLEYIVDTEKMLSRCFGEKKNLKAGVFRT